MRAPITCHRVHVVNSDFPGNLMPPRPIVSVDAALSLIRAYVRYRGWSVYRFAKEAKIARSGIRRLNDPAWNPGTKTLRKLGAAVPANFDPTKAPPPERTP